MMVFAVMVVVVAEVVVLRLAVANEIVELVSMGAVGPMLMDRWQMNAMAAVVTVEMV